MISQICNVQQRQMSAFEDVMRNMAKITETLIGLNHAKLRNDMVGAVMDMMHEEFITKLWDKCPGPPVREPPLMTRMPDSQREHGDMVWQTLNRTMPAPVKPRCMQGAWTKVG